MTRRLRCLLLGHVWLHPVNNVDVRVCQRCHVRQQLARYSNTRFEWVVTYDPRYSR